MLASTKDHAVEFITTNLSSQHGSSKEEDRRQEDRKEGSQEDC